MSERRQEHFNEAFDFAEDLDRVVIGLEDAGVWDASAVAAIDRVVLRLRARGVDVDLQGLCDRSASLVERPATHDKPGAALPTGH
ncbi:MAG: hypothetical protein ACQEXJ_10930 [Myxococcota bacterium]